MALLLQGKISKAVLREYIAEVNEFLDEIDEQNTLDKAFDRHQKQIDYIMDLIKELKNG